MMPTIPIESLTEDATKQHPKAAHDGLQTLGSRAEPAASATHDGDDDVPLPASAVQSLTKAGLSGALFAQLGLNKREAKEFVEAFFELLHEGLLETGEFKLAGFGNFAIRRKAARPGRNPRTGECVPIEARQVVSFRASPALKALVQGDRKPQAHVDSGGTDHARSA